MAMTTQSLTATIAATRAGTRILMREGDDYGARSLQRRRRRGGVATAQRNATHGRRRGARDTAHARRGAQALERGRAYFFRRSRSKVHRQEGCDGRDRISATTGSGAPCAPRATTFPVMSSPRRNFARLVAWVSVKFPRRTPSLVCLPAFAAARGGAGGAWWRRVTRSC